MTQTPKIDADKHAKMRDMVMSWEEISDELIWGAYDVNGPLDQLIAPERLEEFCKRFPHFEDQLRSFVCDWNKRPIITQEMLAAVEHTEISQAEIDRSWRSTKRILDFYRKLREVEKERDSAKLETIELKRQLAEAQRDASHLWNALKDLSFDCDGVTQTQAPNRGTYNSTFLVCKALEGKYGEAEHYEIRTPNMPAVNRYAAIDAAIQEQKI